MSTILPDIETISTFTSWSFEHAAIRVPDFDSAVAWYAKKLDFKLVHSASLNGKTYGFLIPPGIQPSLSIELIAGPGADARPGYEDLGSSLKLSGLHHLAFRVGMVDDTIAELRLRGVTVVSEPHDVPILRLRVAFFADPWGNLFEITHAMKDK